jgi:hypothetical protein
MLSHQNDCNAQEVLHSSYAALLKRTIRPSKIALRNVILVWFHKIRKLLAVTT